MRVDSTLYYVLKDHLGSASVMTDASGNVVGEQRYFPYGETRWTSGNMFTDRLYTGQREMADLGIYHYNARFREAPPKRSGVGYAPKLGRFLSADTIVPGYANPQNLNRFSYVGNNPIKYTDPTGHMMEGASDGTRNGCSNPKYCRDGKKKPTSELRPKKNDEKDGDRTNGGGKESNPFETCYSSSDLNGCFEEVTYDLYDAAGIDLWYTATYPPRYNPLTKYYDLKPLHPQMVINRTDPVNVSFLKTLCRP